MALEDQSVCIFRRATARKRQYSTQFNSGAYQAWILLTQLLLHPLPQKQSKA